MSANRNVRFGGRLINHPLPVGAHDVQGCQSRLAAHSSLTAGRDVVEVQIIVRRREVNDAATVRHPARNARFLHQESGAGAVGRHDPDRRLPRVSRRRSREDDGAAVRRPLRCPVVERRVGRQKVCRLSRIQSPDPAASCEGHGPAVRGERLELDVVPAGSEFLHLARHAPCFRIQGKCFEVERLLERGKHYLPPVAGNRRLRVRRDADGQRLPPAFGRPLRGREWKLPERGVLSGFGGRINDRATVRGPHRTPAIAEVLRFAASAADDEDSARGLEEKPSSVRRERRVEEELTPTPTRVARVLDGDFPSLSSGGRNPVDLLVEVPSAHVHDRGSVG